MPSVIELRLGACLTMRTKNATKLLAKLARDCKRVRNSQFAKWQLIRESGGVYTPKPKLDANGNPKLNKKGEVIPAESPALSNAMQREMYHYSNGVAPDLGTNIVGALNQKTRKQLLADTPYNHVGNAKQVWQAILWHEANRPDCNKSKDLTIPAPFSTTAFGYKGHVNADFNSAGKPRIGPNNLKRVYELSKDSAVLYVSLLSRQSGYRNKALIFRLEARQMSRGNRRLMERVASGEIKMCGAAVVLKTKRNGEKFWTYQLTYEPESGNLGLDTSRVAILKPANRFDAKVRNPRTGDVRECPFVIEFHETDENGELKKFATRNYGNGDAIRVQHERLTSRRRMIAYRSRNKAKGGKKAYYTEYTKLQKVFPDLQGQFVNHLLSRIRRDMVYHDCGVLIYREPTKPVRQHQDMWFAHHGVPFNWSHLPDKLSNSCRKIGVELVLPKKGTAVEGLVMAEWKAGLPDDERGGEKRKKKNR